MVEVVEVVEVVAGVETEVGVVVGHLEVALLRTMGSLDATVQRVWPV